MEQPILTIAIPTYNGTKTIQCMLDLLLAQYDSRVEILISDNCSTDATEEIIGNYVKSHPYLKYYRNKENIGPDANFLQCMKLATGKYIHLLSDDDVMTEGALHKILDFLESNADVSLVYLYTVGFRGKYNGISKCSTPSKKQWRTFVLPIEKCSWNMLGIIGGLCLLLSSLRKNSAI